VTSDLLAVAFALDAAGLNILPPVQTGKKSPLADWTGEDGRPTWKPAQTERTTDRIAGWYESDDRTGIGVVTGAISGNLEMFEFDDFDAYQRFRADAAACDLADLIERIEGGYSERTPGGGIHWFYRCSEIAGNAKLASRAAPTATDAHAVQVLIETRGEGGFAILAPSYGAVHPTRKAYTVLAGAVEGIVTLTPEERADLWDLARSFDVPKVVRPPVGSYKKTSNPSAHDNRPGDEYNAQVSWGEVLEPHGWRVAFVRGTTTMWTRPGRRFGVSATTGHSDADSLMVFSSSTAFDILPASYDRFGAYTLLNHAGDMAAAARELGKQGYGSPPKAATETGTPEFKPTDAGNGELYAYRYGSEVRFDHAAQRWLIWNHHRWAADRNAQLWRWAVEAARWRGKQAFDIPPGDDRTKEQKHAGASESTGKINAMFEQLKAIHPVTHTGEGFDGGPYLIGGINGVVELLTDTLRPGRKEDLITMNTGIVFDPKAECPRWTQFLEEVFDGKADIISFMQRWAGYCLTGSVKEQAFMICYGSGSNGKSLVLTMLRAIMGEYATNISADTLRKQKGGHTAHPAEIAVLKGKRLVTCSETTEGGGLNEERVKALTHGDIATARLMNDNPSNFFPVLKLMIATNKKPVVTDESDGFWRGLLLVGFHRSFEGANRDLDLEAKLMTELPGILAWAVRGAVEWNRIGLNAPVSVRQDTQSYRQESDPLGEFILQCCIMDPAARTASALVYKRYVAWAEAQGYTRSDVLNAVWFGRKIGDRFEKVRTITGARGMGGFRLRTGDDDDLTVISDHQIQLDGNSEKSPKFFPFKHSSSREAGKPENTVNAVKSAETAPCDCKADHPGPTACNGSAFVRRDEPGLHCPSCCTHRITE